MTRVTFQFVPPTPKANSPLEGEISSSLTRGKEKIDGDISVLHLRNGAWIEIDSIGNIRYSKEVEDLSQRCLFSIYDCAIAAMEELSLKLEESYSVFLLLVGEDISWFYIENKNHISRFSQERFNNSDPKYTEIGDERIKISLAKRYDNAVVKPDLGKVDV